MQRISFVTLLLCIGIATTNAQDIATKKAKRILGLRLQASVLGAEANLITGEKKYNDIYHKNSSKLGFRVGFVFNIPITNKFSFTPNINYVNKGSKAKVSSFWGADYYLSSDIAITTSHIEIPLDFTFITDNNKGFIIGLGPVISYGIGGSVTGTETTVTIAGPQTKSINAAVKFDGNNNLDDNTHFRAFEVGGNIFLGYKFSPKYSLSFIYNTSFTDSGPQQNNYSNSYKANYLGLNFGYSFK